MFVYSRRHVGKLVLYERQDNEQNRYFSRRRLGTMIDLLLPLIVSWIFVLVFGWVFAEVAEIFGQHPQNKSHNRIIGLILGILVVVIMLFHYILVMLD